MAKRKYDTQSYHNGLFLPVFRSEKQAEKAAQLIIDKFNLDKSKVVVNQDDVPKAYQWLVVLCCTNREDFEEINRFALSIER